jgi:hypothetical protein
MAIPLFGDDDSPTFEIVRTRGVGAPAIEALGLFAYLDIPAVDVGYPEHVTLAEARNVAVEEGAADWIVFIERDLDPQLPWLAHLRFDLAEADLLTDVAASVGDPASPFTGVCCDVAYRRSALEAAGGFDEAPGSAGREDFDLQLRLVAGGHRVMAGRRAADRSYT